MNPLVHRDYHPYQNHTGYAHAFTPAPLPYVAMASVRPSSITGVIRLHLPPLTGDGTIRAVPPGKPLVVSLSWKLKSKASPAETQGMKGWHGDEFALTKLARFIADEQRQYFTKGYAAPTF